MTSSSLSRVIFIAGYGRNGGTLVDRILGSYPDAFSLGEFRFVWLKGLIRNELCSCGESFRDCPFWTTVFEKAYGGFDVHDAEGVVSLYRSMDRSRYVPLLALRHRPAGLTERIDRLQNLLAPLYRAVAEVSGARVLVDSSKFAGYGWVLSGMPGFEVDVLHLVRDPRATAYSWSKAREKPEVRERSVLMPQASTASAALQWSYRNLASETLASHGGRYLRVRYEDLMEGPENAFAEMRRHLGLVGTAQTPFLGRGEVHLPAGHTQSGNPGRFSQGNVRIRLDDAWKSKMAPRDRRLVSLLTAPVRYRYGY